MSVPNRVIPGSPIFIIADAPGEQEVSQKRPIAGMASLLLEEHMTTAGLSLDRCSMGLVCSIRPPDDNLSKLKVDGPEIQGGLADLDIAIAQASPQVLLLLGKHALWAATGRWNLMDWRGSVIPSTRFFRVDGSPFKCIPSLPPSYCIRQYEGTPLLALDLKRVKRESTRPDIVRPERELVTKGTFDDYVLFLKSLLAAPRPVACDIEGDVRQVQCISFATSPTYSVSVPFYDLEGKARWSLEEMEILWRGVTQVLESPAIPKIWQNGPYDRFVLMRMGIHVQGNADDTMLRWWEWNHELRKSLGFQCSILTDEPYYKDEIDSTDQDTFYRYNAKDSAVTFEINSKLATYLKPCQEAHYRFNHDLLEPLIYMQNRGIRYNAEAAADRWADIAQHVYAWQARLDEEARKAGALDPLPITVEGVIPLIGRKKRKGGEVTYSVDPPKKEFVAEWPRFRSLLEAGSLTPNGQGELAMWLGLSMNTKSPAFKTFLYDTLGLPKQWKVDPKTKEQRLTTDYEALLVISATHDHPAVKAALELSRLRTRLQFLAMPAHQGRMHASYNIVGSETGRITCSKSNLYVS